MQIGINKNIPISSKITKPIKPIQRTSPKHANNKEQPNMDNRPIYVKTIKKEDLEKVHDIKRALDEKMADTILNTISSTYLKQATGLKGLLAKIIKGESDDVDFKITQEAIDQAKKDVSEDGYWGVENTSQRLIDFAKAISGGDASKLKQVKTGFEAGYQKAQEIWGGQLPEISQKTYEATLEKFDQWEKDLNEVG